MDIQKYEQLRKKVIKKDYEGRYKGLDKWLFKFSFLGNIGSVFFATFLVYPALLKTITTNFIGGVWGTIISWVITMTVLTMFELIKRYLIRNFTHEYYYNKKKVNIQTVGWVTIAIIVIGLSFYFSISGSNNLASTKEKKNNIIENKVTNKIDSLKTIYNNKIFVYEQDNEVLRKINNDIRETLAETPINYRIVRKEYQTNIDKNVKEIDKNKNEIEKIQTFFETEKLKLEQNSGKSKSKNNSEDKKIVFLYYIIVISEELLIIFALGFRELYEAKIYRLNQRFEKFYIRKDRYSALLKFLYNNGKSTIGDKVIGAGKIKEIVFDKSAVVNSNKLVDEFLRDMERLGIFTIQGKRRYITMTYDEAIDILENYDDIYQIIENMK